MPIQHEAANVSPFVSKIVELESALDDSQKAQIVSQINCFLEKCPWSLQVKPYHENEASVQITGW